VPSTDIVRVTLPMEREMTVGLGMSTVPFALELNGPLLLWRWKEVTVKPFKPLKPAVRC
jgi:hypothetical protein